MLKSELKAAILERWEKNDGVYDHVEAHGIKDPEQVQIWRNILSRLGTEPLDILDVGTGTGFLALLLAEMGHCVTGVDWSAAMLQKAIAKAEMSNYQVYFIKGDAESLPFSDERFDAVVARHVLWTLTDPEKTLQEWVRVIKPGGWILADISHRRQGEKDHHYPAEIGNQLPLNKNIEPAEVGDIYTRSGMVDIQIEDITAASNRHGANYLIVGRKPGRC